MNLIWIFAIRATLLATQIKTCEVQLGPGEQRQFNKKLRCIPSRKGGGEGGSWSGGGKPLMQWRSGGSVSRDFLRGSSGRISSGCGGSDAPSWRKDVVLRGGGSSGGKQGDEDEEVTSPLKTMEKKHVEGAARKPLFLEAKRAGEGKEA